MQIVIPIGTGSNWDNNELRYCLRAIENKANFDVSVTIIGESGVNIPWLRDVRYATIKRYYREDLLEEYGDRFYESFFCVLDKIRWFVQQDFCEDEFLLFSDDYFLLNEIDDPRIFENVAFDVDKDSKYIKKARSRHERTILEALELAHKFHHHNGLRNCEVHCPRLYKKDLLQNLFHKFPLEKQKVPYALATLYNNLFFHDDGRYVKDPKNKLVAYAHWTDGTEHHYSPTSNMELDLIAKEYKVLSVTDKGLFACEHLVANFIEDRYPVKSRFES
jgi:hypothetical protein